MSSTYPIVPLWETDQLGEFHQDLANRFSNVHSLAQLLDHADYKKYQKDLDTLFHSHELFEPRKKIAPHAKDHVRVTAWNIERGLAYEGVSQALATHPEMADSDVLLLTEVDYGMARSKNRHVARELCQDLNRYGVYVPACLNLDKGNGAEASVEGDNTVALQGHAILSRFPITHVEVVHLPNAKDHLAGKERQIGQESVIVATLRTPFGELNVSPVHLAAHSSRQQRIQQMACVLRAYGKRTGPAVLGGDWNTTTYNAHKPYRAILGFWRRVAMGVHHTVLNHYPFPERYFEKPLFDMLKAEKFETDAFNVEGGCTLHYDFNDEFVRKSLEDWLPQWCFPFVDWALKPRGGVCSFKLDWIAARSATSKRNHIVQDLPKGRERLSDHDPVMVDLAF